ncbi:MAG: tetratricopeptide repeat protein [Deltaproteobacteria bacterium]|jgi:tetratricopeptide (TPR) repeat protein|nr:tetratricopeptide repeat protein [Deltaproteobacteria bacterium]MBT4091904.1 tetratricopeptide repeat protein [Deltaproteobacteria bacterium]MBT4262665.1 tetratricopeptide repeat protein [Deltaproteobacteria bacterium]MBT4643210.1 tetratricopeptide repeat protein [Deltaproteobacteria bacterium]MBT6503749.1 tetratricopeptide repeat protein [Deltaproteobacteria bacterium]
MKNKLMILFIIGVVGIFFTQTSLFAAGGGGGESSDTSTSVQSANFKMGQKAIESREYRAAIGFLVKADQDTPDNADVNNLLGYSYRKLGEFEKSLTHYHRALSIEPEHRGANEYIGELYLQTGNLSQAEKHLKILDKACFWGCEEYDELKEEIAKYKAKAGSN